MNIKVWSHGRILSTELSMHFATKTLDVTCDRHILERKHCYLYSS